MKSIIVSCVFSLFFLLTALPGPCIASELFTFNGVAFGDFPEQNMLCVSGECNPDTAAVTFQPGKRTIFTTYQRKEDLTHLGRVPLVRISYDYFKEKLFRIRLTMQCTPKQASDCIESAMDELMLTYSMGLVASKDKGEDIQRRSYVIDDSIMVNAKSYYDQSESWFPAAEIYDRSLMDIIRKSANPDFTPIPIGGK